MWEGATCPTQECVMGDLVPAALHAWVALASAGRRCDGLGRCAQHRGRWLIHVNSICGQNRWLASLSDGLFCAIKYVIAVNGGWGGIRTLETLARLPVFKTGAFNHSATHP